ncbi:MAG: YaiI/YqxD family protein [Clostridiales bacterium]|nr:YaiI/YqxD family protein [Clostridiales bacterium]
MRILVDADACPVKQIIVEEAKKRNIPVTMIIDTSHELNDGYSEVITVDKARDSVDIKLINILTSEDIVVTQDYGVAAMALGKGAKAINQNGLIYNDNNIDELLFSRFIGQKLRRAGKSTNTAKKRTKEDDENFRTKFVMLLDK